MALASTDGDLLRGIFMEMSFPNLATSSPTSSFRPLYSSSVSRSSSDTMLSNTRIRVFCGGTAIGFVAVVMAGAEDVPGPKAASRAALAISRADGPGGKVRVGTPGAVAVEFSCGGATATFVFCTTCGIIGTVGTLVIGTPNWSTCFGAVGIAFKPMAASTNSSISYPLTMTDPGFAVASPPTPGSCEVAAHIIEAVAGTAAAVAIVAVRSPATLAVSCFPPPKSMPFKPMTATGVTLGSAYSTKQYPLLVNESGSFLTRWKALTFPNACNSSKT
mmetsp:Transcript_6714/g.11631  ORF Transcript_6714/g.11631 Transcript_6714/m.11631 type:complete len:275 (+) Transcript_6714:176-1000(+)